MTDGLDCVIVEVDSLVMADCSLTGSITSDQMLAVWAEPCALCRPTWSTDINC